ncbi:enoyl-CoA hydratase/isomerase family protein [Pseudomarimonas arenosa]|uniref:Enoyl-CoA hydratase/isomerase family protein n=1 Tax=Pseudomarimonas arenosa TaxID=2774145 RepID=A0AAW3ZPK5_9GAMM|nr:enoyl-CoA hydratase/isomerase family protein [Pseudomarimonas arenosa]
MIERHIHAHDVFEIRLARPPVNALNPELLTALTDAVMIAPQEGARSLIVSGGSGVFSAGLDVPYLLTLERAALEEAWRSFFRACAALATSKIPVACAITGHSPAGGAVLSLYADYRVMAEGDFRIGLNETQVGLIIPETIHYALRRLVGAHRAERLTTSGAMIDSAQALRIGMVDELAPLDQVIARAQSWAELHNQLPRSAMLGNRAIARRDLIEATGRPEQLDLSQFLDAWFNEETQSVLHAVVARLKAKRE